MDINLNCLIKKIFQGNTPLHLATMLGNHGEDNSILFFIIICQS